ncbi:MAG: hypothetical protein JEZ03_09490 [Bacteroidales bacterium]|nr:hypothetical protein [Bacteroidales bacterium]
MMKSKPLLIIIILCSVHVFELYYNLGEVFYFVLDAIGFATIFLGIYLRNNYIRPKFQLFRRPLIVLYVALFVSVISCYYFHGQGVISTIIAMRYLFYLTIYFLLTKLKLEKQWLEKMIIVGAGIYLLVFITQVLIFPIEIVDVGRIKHTDRGLLRFRIEGVGFLMLAAFLCLNRFLINRKLLYAIFYGICLGGLFMLGFRTLLLTALFSSYVLLLRLSGNPWAVFRNNLLIFIFLIGLYSIPYVNAFVDEAVEMTFEQADMYEDYIRFRTFDFLYNEVNIDNYTLVLGNGFPQEDSEYGKFVKGVGVEQNGFIFQDLGLIGFGIIYGVLSLLAYLFIAFKAIFIKTKKEDLYLSCYFIYLVTSSITTTEIYRIGIFGVIALALYLIDLSAIDLRLMQRKKDLTRQFLNQK